MGIGSYHLYDNTTDYRDYWASAVSPPPENSTNVEECGWYNVNEKYESDRASVTYTKYYTYHDFSKNLMSKYRSKKKDWKFTLVI